ncbi:MULTISPECIES: DUF3575 domain-containing protein [Niastella]|uniref:DUF3575 domain-containing protein n=1 Tax=Niastella soli TaxID=2821487 RepID=A0ABS3Z1Z0_9BACT|nr:DUF3575 domain-containing protein [Niastella soli]MBO9203426.1 DUF3575 domain-containing protein [Niastella soli]
MKKVVLVMSLAVGFCIAKAQDGGSNAIKINPLSLFLATGNVSFERAITENQTFQLGMFYSGVKISDLKYSGFGITPEYRFYVAGHREAMNGVYVAPFLRYQNFKVKDTDTKDKVTFSSFGGGGLVGWEKSWDSGFLLDLFIGPSYNSGKVKEEGGANEDNFKISGGIDGFTLRTGLTLGFRF